MSSSYSSQQDSSGFTLSTGHFLIPPPPFTSKRICVALLFLTIPSDPKYLWDDQGLKKPRIMFLTLEPLADSLLTPRRDRLHARSPATVAASASRRPSRLLPLRVAGGRKSCSRFGVGRWRIALLPSGTGKSPPPLLSANSAKLSGSSRSKDPSLLHRHPPPYLEE